MRRKAVLLCLWLVLANQSLASKQDPSSESPAVSVPSVIEEYFSGLDAIYRKGSTTRDVDEFIGRFHESIRYVHVNYGADFDRVTWQGAFTRNQEAGRYDKPTNHCSVVTNSIAGKNHHAIEYAYGTLGAEGCEPEDDQRYLVLFGLSDGKINLVQELW